MTGKTLDGRYGLAIVSAMALTVTACSPTPASRGSADRYCLDRNNRRVADSNCQRGGGGSMGGYAWASSERRGAVARGGFGETGRSGHSVWS